jgi:hypothetical protein
MTTIEKPKKLPLPIKLAVGATAGCVGTTCIFPIDMIKTRLQSGGRVKTKFEMRLFYSCQCTHDILLCYAVTESTA